MRLLSYLAPCYSQCEMFQTEAAVNIKLTFLVQLLLLVFRAVYEITLVENKIQPDRSYTTEYMHFAWWINKATKTHLEYAILIDFTW